MAIACAGVCARAGRAANAALAIAPNMTARRDGAQEVAAGVA